MKVVSYLKARFNERSTWAAISGGIVGAAALVAPWSYVMFAVGVIGALVPTGGKCQDDGQ